MNQNQITMTRGDDRTFTFTVDDEYDGDAAAFVVDGEFEKAVEVGADDGSGSSVVTVTIDAEDTEDWPDYREARPYSLTIVHDSETRTVRRGLLVVVPNADV